jgi:2-keto-4-pentenoate hydratase/2-oxohepta-3-ene-1,7-dioic acid hydratase in catechol pathway
VRTVVKLLRLGPTGHERPYVLVDATTVVDVSSVVPDFGGEWLGPASLDALRVEVTRQVSLGEVEEIADRRVGSPLTRPHQILCIGLNYVSAGDVMELGIDGLGSQRQTVEAAR